MSDGSRRDCYYLCSGRAGVYFAFGGGDALYQRLAAATPSATRSSCQVPLRSNGIKDALEAPA
jgi:hypothetical protein